MTNGEKLNAAISKVLDRINESLDKKEAPNPRELEALKTLTDVTVANELR